MKYRKKPIVIEASIWVSPGDHDAVQPFRHPPVNPETGEITAGAEGVLLGQMKHSQTPARFRREDCDFRMHDHGYIDTLEGGHTVCPGDFILTGIKGEHYPCKPDIFDATYEPIEDEGAAR